MTLDLTPILASGPLIAAHTGAAVLAFALGPVALMARRRGSLHRMAGRIWVAAMALTALTAFGIFGMRWLGLFSPIHLLAVLVLVSLWRGVAAARSGQLVAHGRTMANLYVWGLVVPGAFTLLPGRRMHAVFFDGQDWFGFALAALALGLVAVAVLAVQPSRRAANDHAPAA